MEWFNNSCYEDIAGLRAMLLSREFLPCLREWVNSSAFLGCLMLEEKTSESKQRETGMI